MSASWKPPARPVWVERCNDHATYAQHAPMVSLEPDELLSAARAATGLDDFGDADGWRTHFNVFMQSLHDECELTLLGRMMTRADLLRALENRLQLTDLWRRHPEILEADVPAPIVIVGAARSGTSILHELLALDPALQEPTTWKVHHPVVVAEGTETEHADAARAADAVVRFWHDVQPEYEAMHHNHGDLPTECIYITVPMFLSDNWGGTHTVPSYDLHLATTDHTPAYEWHRKVLQTLQWRQPHRRWILKAPSHLPTLRQLFAVYPDAQVIHVHRDPARTLPSMFDLMGTLKWMRTDRVDIAPFIEPATHGIAHLQHRAIADRASGRLPDDQFHDLRYADLIADPVAALSAIAPGVGIDMDEARATEIRDYLAAKPKGSKGTHRYALADFGLEAAGVHEIFDEYLTRFSIPAED